MLNNLKKLLETHSIGLYRDDGLGALKNALGHVVDATRKSNTRLLRQHGLQVTINANIKIANFLDAQFDLETGKCGRYQKPNDQPTYVNKHSNHPPKIIENIPAAIGKRISNISSDQGVFAEAATVHQRALSAATKQGLCMRRETATHLATGNSDAVETLHGLIHRLAVTCLRTSDADS